MINSRSIAFISAIVVALTIGGAPGAHADGLADAVTAYNHRDYATALSLLRPLAEAGNLAAQKQVGIMYHKGEGIKKDNAMALKWFRMAAEQGGAEAQNTLGLFYKMDADSARTLKMDGDLGTAVQDDAEAMKWFLKAADQGYGEAEKNIALIYRDGHGVEQDYAVAAKWFRKAADRGNARSQYEIGLLYCSGLGLKRDYEQAYLWLTVAAANGKKDAAQYRDDKVAPNMTSEEIAKAKALAGAWKVTPAPVPAAAAPAAPTPASGEAAATDAAPPAPQDGAQGQ